MTPADVAADPRAWRLHVRRVGSGTLVFELAGRWHAAAHLPRAADVLTEARATGTVTRVSFASEQLSGWDTGLVVFLRAVLGEAQRAGVATSLDGLPDGVRRLLSLAANVPAGGGRGSVARESLLARVGLAAIAHAHGVVDALAFLGEACVSGARLLLGNARIRRVDFVRTLQDVGVDALPIVALISFLVGVILAYVGAIQLRLFGAQIYVADLVGIAMVREMGAMMAAIIMAGRTGAAFAAQLGTMQVNEEIDALVTMGIPPMEFLVLPRMLALALMMPLLAIYADVLGMVGGAAVGTLMLDLSVTEYYQRTIEAIGLADFTAGAVKASVFGVLVAIAGCLRGMQSGRNAAAVGAAATSAVVTGIVLIVSTDALLTVIFDLVGL
jgi:phospholipid/cholesterol/gamma-HCH transport system permease protein